MREVYIVAAARTAMGSFGGALKDISATQLGAAAIREAVKRSGVSVDEIGEVLMGCVMQGGLGQAPARQAARFAGLPDQVNCTTINKVCSSGLKAVMQGVQAIRLGDQEVVVAGGMESMSNVPYYAHAMRWGKKYGHVEMEDGIAKDGLIDVYHQYPMGNAAELCAKECGISREAQDQHAIESYQRSQRAWEAGKFDAEIAPVEIPQRSGTPVLFKKDEEPWNVKFDKIPTLRPVFLKDGTVTAANASTMNDGASALVLMSGEKMQALGLKPLARVLAYADAEQAPEWFTTSPSLAMTAAVQKAGLTMDQIDYFEMNEAFSVVSLVNMQRMQLSAYKVNIYGGAVSMGHPLGSSGSRILVTLLNVLQQEHGRYGLVGICNGGGGASSLVVEKC